MKSVIEHTLKYWYLPLIPGFLFIILGIWTWSTPLGTLFTVATLFSVSLIISGIIEVLYTISNRKNLKNWGWQLVSGILGLLVGILLISRPETSALIISMYLGLWLLFRFIMTISTAIDLKEEGQKRWIWVLIMGIIGIIFSMLLLANPIILGISLSIWLGFALFLLGTLHIILGFWLKKVKKKAHDYRTIEID
jgi:uncharacterized membrane protein HdeD (DUF308 family)